MDASLHRMLMQNYRIAQYERQKKKWGLLKNNTQEEWEYMIKTVHKRKLDNKDSEIVAHNTTVTSKQLKRAKKWVCKPTFACTQPEGKHCRLHLAYTSVNSSPP